MLCTPLPDLVRRDVNSSNWDPSCALMLETPCSNTTADAVPEYFEVLPVESIDITVNYNPFNMTIFEEELAAEELLEEGAALPEVGEVLPGESSLAAPAAPLARRRKLSSDIGFAVAFSDLDPESMYAPGDHLMFHGLAEADGPPTAMNDTDIFTNPDAFISWVPLNNNNVSLCLSAEDSTLTGEFPNFLVVSSPIHSPLLPVRTDHRGKLLGVRQPPHTDRGSLAQAAGRTGHCGSGPHRRSLRRGRLLGRRF